MGCHQYTTSSNSTTLESNKSVGLLDWWRIVERSPKNSRMVRVEVKLSDWLYRAILHNEVLTLDREYFRLDGGIERRLYELCRKHCGSQTSWSINLPLLYKKSGSRSPIRNFRGAIRKLVSSDHLPEYHLRFSGDRLTVYRRYRSRRDIGSDIDMND